MIQFVMLNVMQTRPFIQNHLLKLLTSLFAKFGLFERKNTSIGKINDKEYLGVFLSILKAK